MYLYLIYAVIKAVEIILIFIGYYYRRRAYSVPYFVGGVFYKLG